MDPQCDFLVGSRFSLGVCFLSEPFFCLVYVFSALGLIFYFIFIVCFYIR